MSIFNCRCSECKAEVYVDTYKKLREAVDYVRRVEGSKGRAATAAGSKAAEQRQPKSGPSGPSKPGQPPGQPLVPRLLTFNLTMSVWREIRDNHTPARGSKDLLKWTTSLLPK